MKGKKKDNEQKQEIHSVPGSEPKGAEEKVDTYPMKDWHNNGGKRKWGRPRNGGHIESSSADRWNRIFCAAALISEGCGRP